MGKRKGPADYSSMKEFVSELQSSCFYFEDTSGLFPAWFVPLLLAWQSRFGGSDVTPWCWHKGIWRRRGTPSSTSMLYHIWNTWGDHHRLLLCGISGWLVSDIFFCKWDKFGEGVLAECSENWKDSSCGTNNHFLIQAHIFVRRVLAPWGFSAPCRVDV